jgi:hypothetical protein
LKGPHAAHINQRVSHKVSEEFVLAACTAGTGPPPPLESGGGMPACAGGCRTMVLCICVLHASQFITVNARSHRPPAQLDAATGKVTLIVAEAVPARASRPAKVVAESMFVYCK